MPPVRCSYCGEPNPTEKLYCGDCGAPLPIVCPECDHPNARSLGTCECCGLPRPTRSLTKCTTCGEALIDPLVKKQQLLAKAAMDIGS